MIEENVCFTYEGEQRQRHLEESTVNMVIWSLD